MSTAAIDRQQRLDLITELVSTYQITSQGELVELLARDGVEVNQATISRDLEQLGIGKQRGADGVLAYVGPEHVGLAQLLRLFAMSIDASGNLAVIRTPPGAAAAVASAIDSAEVPNTLATLQGDDTVLVVAREPATGRDVAQTLASIKSPTLAATS